MDLEFIFVSVRTLKTVDLAGLEGLLNFLSLGAESFANFAEILSFDGKKPRLFQRSSRHSTSVCRFLNSYLFGFVSFLPSESNIFGIQQILKDQSNQSASKQGRRTFLYSAVRELALRAALRQLRSYKVG